MSLASFRFEMMTVVSFERSWASLEYVKTVLFQILGGTQLNAFWRFHSFVTQIKLLSSIIINVFDFFAMTFSLLIFFLTSSL